MPKAMECPYFVWEDKLCLHCEIGVQEFPDRQARDEYVAAYCGDPLHYRNCTLARVLGEFYERTGKTLEKH